jgi:carbamoyl-phosphate synthase large subunit
MTHTKVPSNHSASNRQLSVLIPGVGAGSLGLEIFKALRYAGGYRIIGTDISETAYGLYREGFDNTYLLRRSASKDYADQLLEIALREKIDAIAPGAEEVHRILAENRGLFEKHGILVMLNTPEVIRLCADKNRTLALLKAHDIAIPDTRDVVSEEDVKGFGSFPCVVKPNSMSGGSNLVFIAEDEEEAVLFVTYLKKRGYDSTLQEYMTSEREYTVGVLSSPDGTILGSIAVERILDNKLSYKLRYRDRVISSGWSQGRIDEFTEIRVQAERIAKAMDSRWAINIQGRLNKNGVFCPFEVNPRHSGTTFLRTMAGFNEPHLMLQYHFNKTPPPAHTLKTGYYFRSFIEKFVPAEEIKVHG